MNAREAYRALLDGKKVRDSDGHIWTMDEEGWVSCSWPGPATFHECGPFEIFEEPATYEELIEEMERLALRPHILEGFTTPAHAYNHCAKMLRARKVNP